MQEGRQRPTVSTRSRTVPPEPSPAATVVLIRPSGHQREVLLLRRPTTSIFAPDAWVFPGGRVDDADRRFDHDRLATGPSPRDWAVQLSLPDPVEAAAYVVAAAREAWEETGYLAIHGNVEAPRSDHARSALLRGELSLQDYLDRNRLRLGTGRLRYIAHWITPEWLPRRFDTRFFVCTVDRDARCELRGEELVEFRWMSPAAAIEAVTAGEMTMLPPTLDTLQRLHRGEL